MTFAFGEPSKTVAHHRLNCGNPKCESDDVRMLQQRDIKTGDGSDVIAYTYECNKCGWTTTADRFQRLASSNGTPTP